MASFETIEKAAEALGISARQAWRYLASGRIQKHKTANGGIFFEVSDTTDRDVMTDCHDMTQGHGTEAYNGSKGINNTPLVNSLQEELKASRLQFDLEKNEAMRSDWYRRRNADRQSEIETRASAEAKMFEVRRNQQAVEVAESRRRAIIQRVKATAVDNTFQKYLPAHVTADIFFEIEKLLSRIDLTLPESELKLYAQNITNTVLQRHSTEIQAHVQAIGQALIAEYADDVLKRLRHYIASQYGTTGLAEFERQMAEK